MDGPRLLSGDELVARGTTKIDASLPELGLKDVIPNGSWLEQKQIQSALEARKHLIQVERIEKCGSLSQAEWREELMLAEVTKKVGSHWQYMGHNVGKQLFLKPEEALFLIEVNCLQLKYNDVTVSLQQAYSLLLRGKISLVQYKVYASLSKLGYKVFRHEDSAPTEYEKKINLVPSTIQSEQLEVIDVIEDRSDITSNKNAKEDHCSNQDSMQTDSNNVDDAGESSFKDTTEETVYIENQNKSNPEISSTKTNIVEMDNDDVVMVGSESECSINEVNISPDKIESSNCNQHINKNCSTGHQSRLEALENRKLKPCDSKSLHKCFECIPDLFQKQVVTVKIPQEEHIPKNVFLNNTTYVLNIETIKSKTKDTRPPSTDSRPYSVTEEVNGAHVLRVKDSATVNTPQNNWIPPFQQNLRFRDPFNARFRGPLPQFRPFHFWRPRSNMSYYHLNLLFQRPFLPNLNFMPRFNIFPRPPMFGNFPSLVNFNTNSDRNRNSPRVSRKRRRNGDKHLEAIKKLAIRLKELTRINLPQEHNVESLRRLVGSYNSRYQTRMRLTDEFDIVDESIVETIELDCEDDSKSKKSRIEKIDDKYEENFNKLKQLALKLEELQSKNKVTTRHKRALSSVIKKFNKSYNADVYMNSNYEVLDRRYINLDSSSDSDCVIEEIPIISNKKKLRNPFNILKRLSEQHESNISVPSTSKEIQKSVTSIRDSPARSNVYSDFLTKTFKKNWLPDENDFGRAEIVPTNIMYVLECKREEYLFEFLKEQPTYMFDNWVDVKISFLRNIAAANVEYESRMRQEDKSGLSSIIGSEDYTDIPSLLKKLSIMKTNKEITIETSHRIDFDVYNRDVQNFRKSNRPNPHFRIICIAESASFPSGSEVAAIHSKFENNDVILFAIVGVDSVSYLRVTPTDLPVYIPSNETEFT